MSGVWLRPEGRFIAAIRREFLSGFHSIRDGRAQMKTQCLLRRNQFHTTAWMDARTIKLGVVVEIAELGGLWEIVEIFPYRLTDKQLRTRKTLVLS